MYSGLLISVKQVIELKKRKRTAINENKYSEESRHSVSTCLCMCVCVVACLPPIWEFFQNTGVDGATSVSGITTKTECLAQCVGDANCIAVDMDSNSGATFCWVHSEGSDLDNTRVANNVEHAVLIDRCPPS